MAFVARSVATSIRGSATPTKNRREFDGDASAKRAARVGTRKKTTPVAYLSGNLPTKPLFARPGLSRTPTRSQDLIRRTTNESINRNASPRLHVYSVDATKFALSSSATCNWSRRRTATIYGNSRSQKSAGT